MVRGYFDKFPNSTIYFRKVRRYYVVYTLDWDKQDPVMTMEDREDMQLLLNQTLGLENAYQNRKSQRLG